MSVRDARETIDRLVKELKEHQNRYFKLGRPKITDAEYDRLADELIRLEIRHPDLKRSDSPTFRIGSDLTQDFPEVRHTVPVLSLDKCYTTDEIRDWTEKIRRAVGNCVSFIIEEKIDGTGIVLYYEAGVLARAVTRGNGAVGNDITGNVKTIQAVPLILPRSTDVTVRGEIYLPKHLFEEINAAMDVPYANPRNLAAGTLRRKKSSEVSKVPLDIFIYEGFFPDGMKNHFEIIEVMASLGFRLNEHTGFFSEVHDLAELREKHPGRFFGTLGDIDGFIEEELRNRRKREYEIDGLVLKINEIESRERLGYTGHHPRWAIAFKFESPVGRTRVKDIQVQIGRTGRVTPVARVEPVGISGTTISNVTLHNQEYIDMLELAIGDAVEVSRRGDVIPAVEQVLEKNGEGNITWKMPRRCPTCQSELRLSGAHHFCTNSACRDQVRGRLHFFAGRGQMDIDNLGPETLDALLDRNLIKDIQDIYQFDPDSLLGEPGFGKKKVQLIREGIRSSRDRPYLQVLVSLGIPELGRSSAGLILQAGFRTIDDLLELSDRDDVDALTAIHGLGEKTASHILRELRKPEVARRIDGLSKAGLKLEAEYTEAGNRELPFTGQTWCVTGSFEEFKPREVAMNEVEKRGGKVTTQVSSKTTHLLAGQNPGGKLSEAQKLGVVVINEEEFLAILSSDDAAAE